MKKDVPIILGFVLLIYIVVASLSSKNNKTNVDVPMSYTHEDTVRQLVYMGEVMAKKAVTRYIKTGGNVRFEEKLVEQYYPATGVYWAKWRVKMDDGEEAIAVGNVRYISGDVTKPENWELLNGNIN